MNMIEEAKKQIDALVRRAYDSAAEKGLLPAGAELKGTTEIPKDPSHGDYACSYAMSAAKAMRMAPRKIAETLAGEMDFSRFHRAFYGAVGLGGVHAVTVAAIC